MGYPTGIHAAECIRLLIREAFTGSRYEVVVTLRGRLARWRACEKARQFRWRWLARAYARVNTRVSADGESWTTVVVRKVA